MNKERSGDEEGGTNLPERVTEAYKKDIEDTRSDLLRKQELRASSVVHEAQSLFSIEEYTDALTSDGISLEEFLRNIYQRTEIEGSRAQVNMQRALAHELSRKEGIVLPETAEAKEGLYKLYLELEEFIAPAASPEDLTNALSIIDAMTAIYSSPALSELRKRTSLRVERAQEKQAWDAQ